MWINALKWLVFVALCMSMVYIVYNMGYKFGSADVTSRFQYQNLQLQNEKLDLADQLRHETERRNQIVTDATTTLHKNISKLRSEVESLTSQLNSGGLREDLARQSCVSASDSAAGDHAETQCGLHERDVRDLIDLSRRADEVTEQLTACQGVIEAWTSKEES